MQGQVTYTSMTSRGLVGGVVVALLVATLGVALSPCKPN